MQSDDIRKFLHDLRNPLNTIALNVDLAKLLLEQSDGTDRESLERFLEALETIRRQKEKLSETIDDFEKTSLP